MNALETEIDRLEGRVLSAWVAGPAFRTRYTPDPEAYLTFRNQATARACQTIARLGVTPWGNGDLGTALVHQLASSGDLTKHWGLGDAPLPAVLVRDPDRDLARLHELSALARLQRDLAQVVDLIAADGVTDATSLAATRSAVVEALGRATIGTPILAYSQAEGLTRALQESRLSAGGGIPSGIPSCDQLVGGVRAGHVWVVGAPTNWGKTSLCLAVADVYARRSLIVTCEDAPELLFARLLSRRSGVAGTAIRDGDLQQRDHAALADTIMKSGQHGDVPFVVDGRGRSVERIADYIRVITTAHDIGLVLVDYLQCITTERKTDDRRQEINHIARTLTDAIKTRGAAGILTSQLTDENIRDSRDVEHAAEVVLIGRKNKGELSIYVKKNKTGPADAVIKLTMHHDTGALYEAESQLPVQGLDMPYENERGRYAST